MYRTVLISWLFGLALALPAPAQDPAAQSDLTLPTPPEGQPGGAAGDAPPPEAQAACPDGPSLPDPLPWKPVWGVVGVRGFAAGPKVAPNGHEYHPHSSLDLDFNVWVWRTRGLYLFGDLRFWNERAEYGVTNVRDNPFFGFSKRQFDLEGGPAWNYIGPWEARLYGYTYNNLNRGINPVRPSGLNDGFVIENRYYLSEEYARLGRAGFDVERADFLSVGYYLTKDLVGNDGRDFKPGLMLRAYLTQDLGSWPVFAFGDARLVSGRSVQPQLLLFDLGFAVRPFRDWERMIAARDWELRLGAESTADFHTHSVDNLWCGTIRIVF
jgi:hypothetical protein